jgi:hypothetical protein
MFNLPMALFLSVGAIAVFSFVTIAAWSGTRLKEREAYYRSDMLKKLAETNGGEAVVELIREEERNENRKHRESLKLGGLVTSSIGLGLMVFLWTIDPGKQAYTVGLIPLFIGAALLCYAYVLAPKE